MSTFYDIMAAAPQPVPGSRGVFITSGGATVSSGMTIYGAEINSGMSMRVYSRGRAISAAAVNSGNVTVYSGGTVTGATVSNTLNFLLSSGGRVSGATIGGEVTTRIRAIGGTVTDITLTANGRLYMLPGVTASGVVLSGDTSSRWAYVIVYSGSVLSGVSGIAVSGGVSVGGMVFTYQSGGGGGVIRDAVLDGFQCQINSGGTGEQIAVKSPCALIAESAGIISGAVVSSGGSLTVSSGGTALAVTSNAGAVITVQSGGYIEYTT